MKCPKCKEEQLEVGHYARDYTDMCSKCFAKGFVDSIFGKTAEVGVSTKDSESTETLQKGS